jgi:hypothetical protein
MRPGRDLEEIHEGEGNKTTCIASDGMVLFDFLSAMAAMFVIATSLLHSSEEKKRSQRKKQEDRNSSML